MDYKNPDYTAILRERQLRLKRLRAPGGYDRLPGLRAFYRSNPAQFVEDWGVTLDPRNVELGLPSLIPFVPFAKQHDAMQWLLERWRAGESGLVEKSRDMGCSVTFISLLCTLMLFEQGFVAGIGSRKEMLVDRLGDPNTLFWKARLFLEHVPSEFRGGWSATNKTCNTYMLIKIPATESVMLGEAGENIGRGGRTSIYLRDEEAFMRNQMAVEAALSQTTRCSISLSTINGADNLFATKRHGGNVSVLTFHWRDDPRKDEEWYARECKRLPPVVVAQEIDIDYHASKEGVLIPQVWVQAAIGFDVAPGKRNGGLDVADEGSDLCAYAQREGNALMVLEEWRGLGSDIFATTERTFLLADTHGCTEFDYDGDGLGVGVRGDARTINARRKESGMQQIEVGEYQGSGSVVDPEKYAIAPDLKHGHKGRTNEDFFSNRKAQSWWALRVRFENTYQRRVKGRDDISIDDCISINPQLVHLQKLCRELSQPTYGLNERGKIKVNKAPDDTPSPNLADSVVIAFAPKTRKRKGILDF